VTVSAAASILLLLSAAPQEPPRFSSEVGNVYLDVFVTHKGEPVLGLGAENFEVRDEGVPQEVRLVSLEIVPVAVLLVFDTSVSVVGDALGHLRTAGHAVLDALRPGERAALITFNHQVAVRVAPSNDLDRLHGALDGLQAFGATSLYDAAYAAFTLRVHEARSVIVLFSDGEDTANWLEAKDIRAVAARADIVLQAVGVNGAAAGRHAMSQTGGELQEIAGATGGRFWKAEGSEHLEATFLKILEEMRTRYLLTFQPTGVEAAGEHRLDVRLKGAKGKVRSRRSYYVIPSH
jgi:VWFA-related protein